MNMHILRYTLGVLSLLCFSLQLSAQCQYRLEMLDSYGDGWNGGLLTITIGTGTPVVYTLDNINDDGSFKSVQLEGFNDDQIVFNWVAGGFLAEVSMRLYNADDDLIFTASAPANGQIFKEKMACPECAKVQNVSLDPFDKRVKLRWDPTYGILAPQTWMVIYDTLGFTPGPGVGDTLVVFTPKATVTGLTPKTWYSFYVQQICDTNSVSKLSARYDVETYWTNDIAVTGVLSPQSACDLGAEKIIFQMRNLGAAPQTLFGYNFFVNGESGGVQQPDDGYYTDIIGKDSTVTLEFETTYDFSDPGEYELTVVTQLLGDEDITNDTLRWYFNNILVAPYSQSFDKWNGGWVVSDTSVNSTWAYGVPANTLISANGPDNKAWVTNLSGPYNFFEKSYIESTCFDFSDLANDPAISLLVNYELEPTYDFAAVEMSTDGGASWSKVGDVDEGLNWYTGANGWEGTTNDWVRARHLLNGAKGKSDVRLRIAFNGTFFGQEGIGIDDLLIEPTLNRDAAAVSITTKGDGTLCGLVNDQVTFRVANIGIQNLSNYKINYTVDGGPVNTQTITNNTLSSDENASFTFTAPFNSENKVSLIKCWVTVTNDQNPLNDTIYLTVSHLPNALPFREDFEDSFDLPQDWAIIAPTFGVNVTNTHNNVSNVLAVNLYSFNNTFQYTTPRFGPVSDGDSLRFDYRITTFSSDGEQPMIWNGTTNKVVVEVSTDCGQSFQTLFTINGLNHTPSAIMKTRKASLKNFDGEDVLFRFTGTWGSGDYWFDVDNFGIQACPASMELKAVTVPASEGQNNGSATVNVGIGNPPYKYLWSTGATTQTITGLGIGSVTAYVTDAAGCTDSLVVFIGNSGTNDIAALTGFSARPNPTTGLLMLDIQFDRSVNLSVDLINMLGQPVWHSGNDTTNTLSTQINLADQPAGIYFLRILADGQWVTKRIVKQ